MKKANIMTDLLNRNGATIIQQQAVHKAKQKLSRLAQSDPAAIFKGLTRLTPEEQEDLGYLKDVAEKFYGISKQHILNRM